MEELVISQADLGTIEQNLESVASELSGVVNNVNTFNDQISSIEQNIYSLNDEVKYLMKEIKENTIINNARQNIMYNNEQIEKKYGYFDTVRRTTESMLDAVVNSNIKKSSLLTLREDLLLNNPNYWLSNALAALASWILNDRENTNKELNNALKKNKEKTSAFFCLVYLKLGRMDTAVNWLNMYLNNQDPTNLSSDFMSMLDLVANNAFGIQGKQVIEEKIKVWFHRINADSEIKSEQTNRWLKYISSMQDNDIRFSYLSDISNDIGTLENNLRVTSAYSPVLESLKQILVNGPEEKHVDEILNNLIYEYEEEEQIYQKDNLKNNLIIENDGNREKAIKEYEETSKIYDEKMDLVKLLTNIVLHGDRYKISNNTQKLALSLVKENIIDACNISNANVIFDRLINITVDDFNIKMSSNTNPEEINFVVNSYLNNKYKSDNKREFNYLIVISVLLIIGTIISLKIPLLAIALLVTLLLSDGYIMYKIYKKQKEINGVKQYAKKNIDAVLEKCMAELLEYKNILEANNNSYLELKQFLSNLDSSNYLKTNNERSIDIDEQ